MNGVRTDGGIALPVNPLLLAYYYIIMASAGLFEFQLQRIRTKISWYEEGLLCCLWKSVQRCASLGINGCCNVSLLGNLLPHYKDILSQQLNIYKGIFVFIRCSLGTFLLEK